MQNPTVRAGENTESDQSVSGWNQISYYLW